MSQVNQPNSSNSFESVKRDIKVQNAQSQEVLKEGRKRVDEAFSLREAEIKKVGQDLNAQQEREQRLLNEALFQWNAQLEEQRRREELDLRNITQASDRRQETFTHSLQSRQTTHQENIQRQRHELEQKRLELERERQQRMTQQSVSFSSTQQQTNNYTTPDSSFSEYPSFQGTRGASSATRGAIQGASSIQRNNPVVPEYNQTDENNCTIS